MKKFLSVIAIAIGFSLSAAAQPAPVTYELACPAGYSPLPNSGKSFDSLTGQWRANFCIAGNGSGTVVCQANGCGSTGGITAGSKLLYVDGNRTDPYSADGSPTHPFKTIMGAVNQVIANGDNSTQIYQLEIAPATYVETVDLSNSALYNLILNGPGAKIAPSSGNALQNTNNNNLFNSTFIGLTFSKPVSFSYTAQAPSTDWIFFEHCVFLSDFTAVGASAGHSSPEFFFFDVTSGSGAWTFTDNYQIYFYASQIGQPDTNTGSFTINASGSGYTKVVFVGSYMNVSPITVGGAGGTSPNQARLYVSGSQVGAPGNSVVVNGQLNLDGGEVQSNITVNAGGTITYWGGRTYVTPTLSGGSLGFLMTLGAQTFLGTTFQSGSLTGPTWTSGTGSPEGVKTAPVGSTFSRTDGSAGLSNYVKSTGTGNTGWLPIPAGAIASFNAPQKVTSTGDLTMTTSGTVYTLLSESVTMPASAGSYRVLVSYSQWFVAGGNVCSAVKSSTRRIATDGLRASTTTMDWVGAR